jgi:hypothetical protein
MCNIVVESEVKPLDKRFVSECDVYATQRGYWGHGGCPRTLYIHNDRDGVFRFPVNHYGLHMVLFCLPRGVSVTLGVDR